MSTTVKYKGQTIGTVSNTTRKIDTKGKYCEDDITITDSGGGGSAVLETLQVSYTPSETAISDTQTPSQGYDGFDEAQISVAAIPSSYVGSGVSRQAAQTIHPSTSDQTIAADKYLSGAQTIKGVLLTNLTAENIKKDVVVEVGDATDSDCVTSVTGTFEGAEEITVTVVPTADTVTLTVPVGSFTLPTKYIVIITADIPDGDPNRAYITNVFYAKATRSRTIAVSNAYIRMVTTRNTDGGQSSYTSKAVTVAQSGTNVTVKVNSTYYKKDATYIAKIYNISDADI